MPRKNSKAEEVNRNQWSDKEIRRIMEKLHGKERAADLIKAQKERERKGWRPGM